VRLRWKKRLGPIAIAERLTLAHRADDHSRVAYADIHDDKTAATVIRLLRRAWPVSAPARSPSNPF
jgi:hypothetical protein